MKIEKINNWKNIDGLNQRMEQALAWMEAQQNDDLPAGRVDVDGDNIFVMVNKYQSNPAEKGLFEAHREYMDIQFMIKGKEKLFCTGLDGLQEHTAYDAQGDAVLFDQPTSASQATPTEAILSPGEFVVFLPEHAHMPGCQAKEGQAEDVLKFVAKVKL